MGEGDYNEHIRAIQDQQAQRQIELLDKEAAVTKRIKRYVIAAIVVVLVLVVGFAAGCPKYNVYKRTQQGKAALQEAVNSKKVQIEEATANLASEKLNAQAEVERAKGAAEAIEIEGGKLTPDYIRYLWIRQLDLSRSQTIYIPTEAGLPVLEAGKRP